MRLWVKWHKPLGVPLSQAFTVPNHTYLQEDKFKNIWYSTRNVLCYMWCYLTPSLWSLCCKLQEAGNILQCFSSLVMYCYGTFTVAWKLRNKVSTIIGHLWYEELRWLGQINASCRESQNGKGACMETSPWWLPGVGEATHPLAYAPTDWLNE